ncbi:hypothetical protein BVC80_7939g8 [Macleaya cordata]|uniref:Uncharacterized protein n=1 Tax=Macleaya cordata TaxID=56857 RepID=A0A200PYQ4_MACCD|nr:hypothetical protein BVC80_7939g8 [Macleaya cordata]
MSHLMLTRKRKLEVMMDSVQTILDVGIMCYYICICAFAEDYYNRCILETDNGKSNKKARSLSMNLKIDGGINLITSSFSKFVDGTMDHLKSICDAMAQESGLNIQLFKELDKIDGLSEDDIIEAAKIIIDSSTKTKLFFGMSDERRAIYVKTKILKPSKP